MRISDWSSDVCSSDLAAAEAGSGRRCRQVEELAQLALGPDEVRQGVAVEDVQEGLQGLADRRSEDAAPVQAATGRAGAEAFDDAEIGLGPADDVADADLLGPAGQGDAAALAADRLEDAFVTEVLHDLHQVILGDPVAVGDLLDGRPRFALEAEVHHDPEGEIGVDGYAPRWTSAVPAAPGE